VNTETGEVRSIGSGERPEGSVLSKDGRFIYVANREGRSITIIDTGTNQAAGAIATGSGPVRIGRTPDGSLLVYAAMHDKAVEIADPVARKVVGRILLPARSGIVSLQVSPDGAIATASAEEDDTVYVVSIPERRLIRTLRMPKGTGPDPAFWPAEK
jgi:YVTN family beta-propeller protein